MASIYRATESFVTHRLDGTPVTVQHGTTHVSEDDELYKRFPQNFEVVFSDRAVEAATAAPGEERESNVAGAKAKAPKK